MGSVRFELLPGELVVVGGDYGQIVLEGATPAARKQLDSLVEATRFGSGGPVCSLICECDDRSPAVVENRHAGLEGTHERGAEYSGERDAAGEESAPETRAG